MKLLELIIGCDVENIGYMVPAPVIKHFLADGRWYTNTPTELLNFYFNTDQIIYLIPSPRSFISA